MENSLTKQDLESVLDSKLAPVVAAFDSKLALTKQDLESVLDSKLALTKQDLESVLDSKLALTKQDLESVLDSKLMSVKLQLAPIAATLDHVTKFLSKKFGDEFRSGGGGEGGDGGGGGGGGKGGGGGGGSEGGGSEGGGSEGGGSEGGGCGGGGSGGGAGSDSVTGGSGGHSLGQDYNDPNNPNSSRVPGKENIYTHGEMPSWSGTTAPALPPSHVPTDNLNAQKQPSTAQVSTSAQAPSVLPTNVVFLTPAKPPLPVPAGQGHHVSGLRAPSTSPTTGQSGNALPAQGQNRTEDAKGRTVSRAPTSSQRPGVLPPGPTNFAYPTSLAAPTPEHHSNSLSPSTAQVQTSGQAPLVLSVVKPDAANQDGSDELDLDVLEVTALDKTTERELVPASGGKNGPPLSSGKGAVPANGKVPVVADSKAPAPAVPEGKKPAESEKKEDDPDYENETFDRTPSHAKNQHSQNKAAAESVPKFGVRLRPRRTTVKPVPAQSEKAPPKKPSQLKPQFPAVESPAPAPENPSNRLSPSSSVSTPTSRSKRSAAAAASVQGYKEASPRKFRKIGGSPRKLVRRKVLQEQDKNTTTPTMRKLLLLSNCRLDNGSGYLEYAKEKVLEFFTKSGVKEILFVPYANVNSQRDYTNMARTELGKWGFAVKGLNEVDNPIDAVNNAQAIFIGGGNTFLLLKLLQENQLLEPIRRRVFEDSVPFMGSSAGTNVATYSINTTNDMPIVHCSPFQAIGLVPFNINPNYIDTDEKSTHMRETRETRIQEYHALCSTIPPVLALRDGSFLEVQGDVATLGGLFPSRIFIQGKPTTEYSSGTDVSFLLK